MPVAAACDGFGQDDASGVRRLEEAAAVDAPVMMRKETEPRGRTRERDARDARV